MGLGVTSTINEQGFSTYAVRFDIDDHGNYFYDLNTFINSLTKEIPDFAYGGPFWKKIMPSNHVEALAYAAKAIYLLPEFKHIQTLCQKGKSLTDDETNTLLRKGEFGELILFFLLKHFHHTIPLFSKIYFKDTINRAVHGFDAIHYEERTKSLWLGESKCYENCKLGLQSLVKDIKTHITSDYLKTEFTLVSKKFKLATNLMSKREQIIDLLNPETRLEHKISSITFPLLCTFTSPVYSRYHSESKEFLDEYKKEMNEMKQVFMEKNDHPLKNKINILLLLMPVKSKFDLIIKLHERISAAQSLLQ